MTDDLAFTPSSTDLSADWPREPGDSMTFAPALSAEEQAIVDRFEAAPDAFGDDCCHVCRRADQWTDSELRLLIQGAALAGDMHVAFAAAREEARRRRGGAA